jgi:hypothetical protein
MKIKICAIENGTFRFFKVDGMANIINKPVTMDEARAAIRDSQLSKIYELREVDGEPLLLPAVEAKNVDFFVWNGARYFYDEGTLYAKHEAEYMFYPVMDMQVVAALGYSKKHKSPLH